ncbi:hypothetical protein ABID97_000944 [Variovorax sp. OAS795]|uniref:hypothetical protein n=1 Tax=Variovorax sp. OAS795 TaxID=3034231 RepID=UPI00339B9194
MREDMDKVIVERPRRGGGVQGDGRQWRNSRERGSHLGMTQGYRYRKGLNENLAPLRRWLHKQVHRPWDKVYAELCSGIDRRSTVQAHIFEHIDDFVEREAVLRDGEVWVRKSWWRSGGERVPLRDAAHVELFVHPATGILLPNRLRRQGRQQEAAKRRQAVADRLVIDAFTEWHRIDGCWFEVRLAPFPEPQGDSARQDKRFDVMRGCLVTRSGACHVMPGMSNRPVTYARAFVHAVAKRQLSRREVRARLGDG